MPTSIVLTQRIVVSSASQRVSVVGALPPVDDNDYVVAGGDTMTGALTVPSVIIPTHGSIGTKLTSLDASIAARTPTAWAGLSLLNGWLNFGGGFQSTRYRKVGDVVEIEGLLNGSARTNVGIAVLPAGYRPVANQTFTTDGNHAFARVDINNIGQIVHTDGDNAYLSLFNIRFSTI